MEIKWIDDRKGKQTIIIHINGHTIEVSEEGDGFTDGTISMCRGEYGSLETMLKHKWVYRKSIDIKDEFEAE
jgi:hypothetical protein|tara:strand:+ start:230 stop:445 length:216 start_codon:yes stop_codon:yes gene_type:complete